MIEISDLTIKNRQSILIPHLNITFKKGEFWAILGKNGTGKTTLLHTLAGLQPYDNGSIKLNNSQLSDIKPMQRAQNIALLSQLLESGLDCSVEQAVSYGRYPWKSIENANKQEMPLINSAIDAMQLGDLRNQSIQQISGGELRKVEIATILAQNSDIFMLDEPLNHLDLAYRYILMNMLKELSSKKLIIMVTHDIQYVKAYCSHVLLISNNGESIHGTVKSTLKKVTMQKMLGINLPENMHL